MAYMSQERKASLAPAIRAILKKYGVKGSLSVDNHSSLVLTVSEGPIDFGVDYLQVNTHWIGERFEGKARKFLTEVVAAMNVGNHNRSDISIDRQRWDGWYVKVNIGRWSKPYNKI